MSAPNDTTTNAQNKPIDPTAGLDITQITRDIYEKNAELVTKNKILSTLRSIYDIINKSLQLQEISQQLINKITTELDFGLGLILIKVDEGSTFRPIAAQVNTTPKLEELENSLIQMTITDTTNPIIQATLTNKKTYLDDKSVFLNLFDPTTKSLIEKTVELNSILVYPFSFAGKVQGIILLGSSKQIKDISETNQQILDEVVYVVSIGLENARLFSQSTQLTKQLQVKNTDLSSALDLIQESQRRERDMIDIMGHELRTPITIVRNAVSLLADFMKKNADIPRPTLEKYVDMAAESAEREISIIETLLSATKVDSDHLQIFREDVDFLDVINDSMVALKGRADRKGLQLIYTPPATLSKVYADRTRIQEVVDNLLSNAIKYTEKGHVEIQVKEEGDFIRCSLIDTGYGIPKEDIASLGKKFFRVKTHLPDDSAQIVRPGGTGLGLYVTFAIIKIHGGEVKIESEVGKGSTFSFTVPKYSSQKIEKDARTQEKDLFKRMGLKAGAGSAEQQEQAQKAQSGQVQSTPQTLTPQPIVNEPATPQTQQPLSTQPVAAQPTSPQSQEVPPVEPEKQPLQREIAD